jgi:hypothetical protein
MMRVFLILALLIAPAIAQVHHHDGETAEVDKFYSEWMRPDNPNLSCCNKLDCYATEVKVKGGTWFARQRESGNWVTVPPGKIEQIKDSPDGRSHVCMSPNTEAPIVFCLKLGGGA